MFTPVHSKSAAAPPIRPQTPFFQPKLTVNTPGDAYEQEADRVADQVMRMKTGDVPVVQRMPITPLSVQRKCADCEKEEKAMRKETGGSDASGKAAPAAVSDVLSSGGGQPMDSGTRQWAESRFGQDFSQVRVHTDARAADSAAAIQARAYTSGSNVVFGAGQYQPQSESGQRLLAHELVHVGQQGGAQVLRQATGAAPTPPALPRKTVVVDAVKLRGATKSRGHSLTVANEIFAPCNVQFRLRRHDATDADSNTWLGGDTTLDGGTVCGSATSEETALYTGASTRFGLSGRIKSFFVHRASDAGVDAYSFPATCGGPFNDMAVVTDLAGRRELAHEIAHILLNGTNTIHSAAPGNIMADPNPGTQITPAQCATINANA